MEVVMRTRADRRYPADADGDIGDRSRTAILLCTCPDRKGIVARIAGFIHEYGGNIVFSQQHIDFQSQTFFQRVEWELTDFRLYGGEIEEAFDPLATQFQMEWRIRFSDEDPRVVIFVSRHEHCLIDLLYRFQRREFPGKVVGIVSNHPDSESLVTGFQVPYYCFPITAENKRAEEEKELQLLESLDADLIVLARYMQVLTADFVDAYPNQIVNIHHSFLPAFVGPRPYHRAFERGVKLIGATSHYVTEEIDEGPIIEQGVARVSHNDSLQDFIRKGRDLECLVLARAVRSHLRHRVLPCGPKTIVFE